MRAPRTLRIGSRGSTLALRQTAVVTQRLERHFPKQRFEIVVVSTRGDEHQTAPIASLGEGAFVKAIEQALVDNRIDLAVHSLKDIPVQPGEHAASLVLAAFPERVDPRDVLVSRAGLPLERLPSGARVATGSPRRSAQLLALRPDLRFQELRGNIDTRLRKLREQGLDALVVAAAALARLDLLGEVTQYFDPELVTPAVGQGALAIQCRADDAECRALATAIDDKAVRVEITAERAVLAELGGGCRLPVGALARLIGNHVTILGALGREDGTAIVRASSSGPASDAERASRRLAAELRASSLVPSQERTGARGEHGALSS